MRYLYLNHVLENLLTKNSRYLTSRDSNHSNTMSLHAPGRLDHFLHGLLTQLAESEKVALGMEKHGEQTMTGCNLDHGS